MGKRRDIMYSYHKENCEDRFEFMYEHYYYYKTVLSSRKACTIYSIESYMRKEHWDEYFKLYNVQKREALISRVSASMDKGESIDYLICEEGLPESILEHYKDYLAMKIDSRIFSCALKSIGGKDEELLRRYGSLCKSKFQICYFEIQKTGIKKFTLRVNFSIAVDLVA